MNAFQAAILGIVQGLGEFLPISSSGHLALLPWMLRWPDQGLAYDIALHWGTLAALLVYFRKDLLGLASAALKREDSQERRLCWGIVLATVPGAVVGLILEDYVETVFRAPQRIASMLILFGLVLWAADRWGKRRSTIDELTIRDCVLIGAAQALAVIPGVSRSAITISAGLGLGLKRVDAARFSFLLATPIVIGAGVLKVKDLSAEAFTGSFWIGIVCAGLAGFGAIRFLLRYVESRDLGIFVAYRIGIGLLTLLLVVGGTSSRPAKELALDPPKRTAASELSPKASALRTHVDFLAGEIGERSSARSRGNLARARDYIADRFREYGYEPELDAYPARHMAAVPRGTEFHNVIAHAGEARADEGLWIVGAHYDTAIGTPGADDNTSGTAVLLELAKRLGEKPPPRRVRLIAFSTEEPPAFGTVNMGSFHDAQRMRKEGVEVEGMIALEMLGYYDSRPGSQGHPAFLGWLTPDKGDFIAAVGNWPSRRLLKFVKRGWPRESEMRLVARTLPDLQVIRLSDHASYWNAGFPAVMITDTAYYRNPHYHTGNDVPDLLDYESMALVTDALEAVLRSE